MAAEKDKALSLVIFYRLQGYGKGHYFNLSPPDSQAFQFIPETFREDKYLIGKIIELRQAFISLLERGSSCTVTTTFLPNNFEHANSVVNDNIPNARSTWSKCMISDPCPVKEKHSTRHIEEIIQP